MEHVLLNKRINGVYQLPNDTNILPVAKTFLKSVNEIKYVQDKEKNNYLVAKKYEDVTAQIFLKYGPFIAYLNGSDARAILPEKDKNAGVTPE